MRSWSELAVPAACIIAVVIVSGHGVGSGLATHGDSRTIVEESVPAILQGSYFPSRSFGDPLYEYVVAALLFVGGLHIANLYSLLLAVGSIWLFDRLIDPTIRGARRFCALAALSLCPLFLINAFAVTEWMQTVLLLLCLLSCARRWIERDSTGALVGLGVCSVLLTLTRPDAAIVCSCVVAAMLWHSAFAARRSAALALTLAIAGATTLAIFGVINHGFAFLKSGLLLSNAPYLRRLVIASVGVYSTFGLLAPIIVLRLTGKLWPEAWTRGGTDIRLFWSRLFLIAAPIFLVRFVLLPDKLEYILPLLVLATLMIVHQQIKLTWLVLYAVSVVLPSIVTLSLFERTGANDALSVRPRIGPGAVQQELSAIRYNWQLMQDPARLQVIAVAVYPHTSPRPSLRSENWAAGLLSDTGDLVIGQADEYHLDNPRSEAKYQRHLYANIYLCNHSVWVNGSLGWRLAEPPVSWPSFASDGSSNLICFKERA